MEVDNCIPRFFIKPIIDSKKTKAEGTNVWKDAEYVEIIIPNSRDSWIGPVDAQHIKRWPSHYDAFKKGQDAPLEGTPLDVWPAITPAVVENLKRANVKTIEALASMPETNLQRFGPDMSRLIQKARAYLSSKADTAEVSKLVEENETLKRSLADQAQHIEELKDEIKKLKVKKKAA